MAKSLGRIISPEILYSALFTYFSASAGNIFKSTKKKKCTPQYQNIIRILN
jgi:hypothetical protein